jgi:hypothetical protein
VSQLYEDVEEGHAHMITQKIKKQKIIEHKELHVMKENTPENEDFMLK